jgi:hypothetical protein
VSDRTRSDGRRECVPIQVDCSRVTQVEELQLGKGPVDSRHDALMKRVLALRVELKRMAFLRYLDDVRDEGVVTRRRTIAILVNGRASAQRHTH